MQFYSETVDNYLQGGFYVSNVYNKKAMYFETCRNKAMDNDFCLKIPYLKKISWDTPFQTPYHLNSQLQKIFRANLVSFFLPTPSTQTMSG